MPRYKVNIGQVEVEALSDGFLDFDPCEFFPSVEEQSWEHYPGSLSPEHRVNLNLGSFLLRSQGRTILVDTGLGPKPADAPNAGWGELLNDLKEKGVDRDAIDMVVFTHLHRDHVGWNLLAEGGRYVPTFPKARYWIPSQDWNFFKNPDTFQRFPTTPTCVVPLEQMGLMELMEDNHAVTSEITAILTPGHTPGHMSLMISSQGEKGVILGDVAHHTVQVHELEWCSRADLDPATAIATRRAVWERLELEAVTIAAGHFPFPGFGKLLRADGRRYWQAAKL